MRSQDDLAKARRESETALATFNAGMQERAVPVPNWRALFAEALTKTPSSLAVVDEDNSLSFSAVHERASVVAKLLTERGCAGGTICIYMPRNAACCWVAIGALLCKTQFIDVAAWNKPNDLVRILGVVKPDLVVTSRALAPNLPSGTDAALAGVESMQAPLIVEDLPTPSEGSAELVPLSMDDPPDDPDRTAFSVLTSGTTSVSKIVLCPLAALTDAMPYFKTGLNDGDKVGLFWIYYYFLCPMLMKCTPVILPDRAFLDPAVFLGCVRRHQLAAIYVTPSVLELCIKTASPDEFRESFATVRVIWLTGEKLKDETRAAVAERAPHARMEDVYSANESGDLAIASTSGGSLKLLQGVQAQVRDGQGRIVPRGAVGALHVHTAACYNGYWAAQGVVVHERGAPYNTGDLIRWMGDGRFKFVSRQKGAHIKVRGYKVFPNLIEDVMNTHPAIDTAWVAGVGTDDTNARIEVRGLHFGEGGDAWESSPTSAALAQRLPSPPHLASLPLPTGIPLRPIFPHPNCPPASHSDPISPHPRCPLHCRRRSS